MNSLKMLRLNFITIIAILVGIQFPVPLKAQTANELERVYGLTGNQTFSHRVETVGSSIALALGTPDVRFLVLELEEKDSITVDNDGLTRVYLTSAFTETLKDQEIAFIIAHDLAHAFFRHPIQRNAMYGLRRGSYSLKQEEEADKGAIKVMKEAGLDTKSLHSFLEGFKNNGELVGWLSSHPISEQRLNNLMTEVKGSPDKILIRRVLAQGENSEEVNTWIGPLVERRLGELGFAVIQEPDRSNPLAKNFALGAVAMRDEGLMTPQIAIAEVDLVFSLERRRSEVAEVLGAVIPYILNIPGKPELGGFMYLNGRLTGVLTRPNSIHLKKIRLKARTATKPSKLGLDLTFLPREFPPIWRHQELNFNKIKKSNVGKLANKLVDEFVEKLNKFTQKTQKTAVVTLDKFKNLEPGDRVRVEREGRRVAIGEVLRVVGNEKVRIKVLKGKNIRIDDRARLIRTW